VESIQQSQIRFRSFYYYKINLYCVNKKYYIVEFKMLGFSTYKRKEKLIFKTYNNRKTNLLNVFHDSSNEKKTCLQNVDGDIHRQTYEIVLRHLDAQKN